MFWLELERDLNVSTIVLISAGLLFIVIRLLSFMIRSGLNLQRFLLICFAVCTINFVKTGLIVADFSVVNTSLVFWLNLTRIPSNFRLWKATNCPHLIILCSMASAHGMSASILTCICRVFAMWTARSEQSTIMPTKSSSFGNKGLRDSILSRPHGINGRTVTSARDRNFLTKLKNIATIWKQAEFWWNKENKLFQVEGPWYVPFVQNESYLLKF